MASNYDHNETLLEGSLIKIETMDAYGTFTFTCFDEANMKLYKRSQVYKSSKFEGILPLSSEIFKFAVAIDDRKDRLKFCQSDEKREFIVRTKMNDSVLIPLGAFDRNNRRFARAHVKYIGPIEEAAAGFYFIVTMTGRDLRPIPLTCGQLISNSYNKLISKYIGTEDTDFSIMVSANYLYDRDTENCPDVELFLLYKYLEIRNPKRDKSVTKDKEYAIILSDKFIACGLLIKIETMDADGIFTFTCVDEANMKPHKGNHIRISSTFDGLLPFSSDVFIFAVAIDDRKDRIKFCQSDEKQKLVLKMKRDDSVLIPIGAFKNNNKGRFVRALLKYIGLMPEVGPGVYFIATIVRVDRCRVPPAYNQLISKYIGTDDTEFCIIVSANYLYDRYTENCADVELFHLYQKLNGKSEPAESRIGNDGHVDFGNVWLELGYLK